MTGIYALTLRAADGREHTDLWWLPTEATRQDLYERWRKRGIEIIDEKEIL